MSPVYTGIETFAGAGGMSLGLQKAGFDVRYAFDIDPFVALACPLRLALPTDPDLAMGSQLRNRQPDEDPSSALLDFAASKLARFITCENFDAFQDVVAKAAGSMDKCTASGFSTSCCSQANAKGLFAGDYPSSVASRWDFFGAKRARIKKVRSKEDGVVTSLAAPFKTPIT